MHGSRAVYELVKFDILGLRDVAFVGCGTRAESGCCAVPAAWAAVDPGDGSEHRVNETEHSHLRYAI